MDLFICHKKKIGWLTLATFLFLLSASPSPLCSEKNAKGNSPTAYGGPGLVERVNRESGLAKKRRFPWLLLAAVVVAGGAAAYFLLANKPEYTLTVTLGEGVSANLPAGPTRHKKGSRVAYGFTAKDGYKKLTVTLDTLPADTTGKVTMDRDHTLAATAVPGIDEQFTSAASELWQPRSLSHWSVANGSYVCSAVYGPIIWDYNVYNYAAPQDQFVVEVRVRKMEGETITFSNGFGLFDTAAPLTNTSGFSFNTSANGGYSIIRLSGFNVDTYTSTSCTFIDLGYHSAVHQGLGQWNVLRVARSGSSYTFYINGTVVKSFSDNSCDPRYLALLPVGELASNRWEYDYVILSLGSILAQRQTWTESNPANLLLPER